MIMTPNREPLRRFWKKIMFALWVAISGVMALHAQENYTIKQLENDQKKIETFLQELVEKMERVCARLEKQGATKEAERMKAALVKIKIGRAHV